MEDLHYSIHILRTTKNKREKKNIIYYFFKLYLMYISYVFVLWFLDKFLFVYLLVNRRKNQNNKMIINQMRFLQKWI